MNKLKYLSGILAMTGCLFLGSYTLHAQTPPAPATQQQPGKRAPLTPEQRAERRIKAMKKNLSITDDQANKLRPVLIASIQQMDDIKHQPKGVKGAKKEQMMQMKNNLDAQMKSILTPEQYQKMKDMQEQQKEKRKAGRNNAPSQGQPQDAE